MGWAAAPPNPSIGHRCVPDWFLRSTGPPMRCARACTDKSTICIGEVARLREDATGGVAASADTAPTRWRHAPRIRAAPDRRLAKLDRQRALTAKLPEQGRSHAGHPRRNARRVNRPVRPRYDGERAPRRRPGIGVRALAGPRTRRRWRTTTRVSTSARRRRHRRADGLPEVKGRVEGADSVFVSYNEVLHALNTGPQHRLVLVSVSRRAPYTMRSAI